MQLASAEHLPQKPPRLDRASLLALAPSLAAAKGQSTVKKGRQRSAADKVDSRDARLIEMLCVEAHSTRVKPRSARCDGLMLHAC
eukprot:6195779-Pleurochrysis_carterae.AAC.8